MEALFQGMLRGPRGLPSCSFTFLLQTSISGSLGFSAFNTERDREAHIGEVGRGMPGSGTCHFCSYPIGLSLTTGEAGTME